MTRRRASIQIYPFDWMGNANLRLCTWEEKGVWFELICLFHDSPTAYGTLRWTLKEIAGALGCKVSILMALVRKRVLKGADAGETCQAFTYTPRSGRKDGPTVTLVQEQPGPLWYSSRMVTDEYKALVRASNAPSDGENEPGKDDAPKGGIGDGIGEGSGAPPTFTATPTATPVDLLLRSDQPPDHENLSIGPKDGPSLLTFPLKGGKSYPVTQVELDRWHDAFPKVDPLAEAKKLKFWLETHPEKLNTFSGMGKRVSSWFGNASNPNPWPGKQPPAQDPKKGKTASDYIEENAAFFGEAS